MSRPIVLQDDFSGGAMQDVPRHQLPKGKVYQCTDFIPEFSSAPLARRGGWARTWPQITGANYLTGVQIAPFSTGSLLVAWDDDGDLHHTPAYAVSTWTTLAHTLIPAHPPTFWKDMLIVADVNGTGTPYRFDGSATTNLGGTPPTGSMSTVYKNHLVLARSSSQTRRVWFSSANDYDAWDTAADGQWLDMDMPVQGITSLRNMILVFGEGKTQRIRGDVIPGVVGSDMVVEPLFSIGCSDPASIATKDDYAVFANSSGVYLTDGIGVANLTEESGMSRFWKTALADYASSWTIAAAVHNGWYVFSVMNGSVFKLAGMIDVKRRRYVNLTNIKATMMIGTPPGILDVAPKLVFADRASSYPGDATSMWLPANGNKNDGDGTAVTPSLELPHYYGRPGKKRWHRLYVKYYMTDAATDNPTLTASYSDQLAPVVPSYTNLSPTLNETTSVVRQRLPVNVSSEGLSLKLTQANASALTFLYAIEADVNPQEPGRL